MYKGAGVLREVIENAELYPIRGLFNFSSFFHDIEDYYCWRNGYERGVSTCWIVLNDLYNVREHAKKLLEKHIGKPFFDARSLNRFSFVRFAFQLRVVGSEEVVNFKMV
ncbi:uncharacterized protein A4U43_C04F23720 [Asparagus officinalis]|uniref:Uncharacterized protein n=1 Tax=Asparagus officinalis TaxID=4686 RepID=A0A5P1F3A0_ASPOF|nr:uncharacterized protein A4U43_C04F23720 [Asparagus officinalis]